jgi:hypothetical protein
MQQKQKDKFVMVRNILVGFCQVSNISLNVDRVSFPSVDRKIQIFYQQNLNQIPIIRKQGQETNI